MHRIQPDYRINIFKWTVLPFFYFRNDPVCDCAYRSIGYFNAVHFAQMTLNVAVTHSASEQRYDLFVNIGRERALAFPNCLRFERAVAVAWSKNFKAAQRALNIFLRSPVATVFLFCSRFFKMLIQFSFEGSFKNYFQQRSENTITACERFARSKLFTRLAGELFKIKFFFFHI